MRGVHFRWWWLAPLPVVAVVAHLHTGDARRAIPVTRAEVVQTVVVSGRVLAPAKVSLGVLSRGRAAQVLVEAGAEVQRGELLLVLDDTEARASLAKAEARLASARARLSQLAARDVGSAESRVDRAEAEFAHARAQEQRTEGLVAGGALAVVEEELARVQVARAREQLQSARLGLDDARPAGGDGQAATAAVRDGLADVALARVRLEQTRLTAPADGVILERGVEPGDILDAGARAFTLAVKGPVRLRAQPDERALGLLRVGNLARASADAFPGSPFDARVDWIAPGVDDRRGTIEVRLQVPTPPSFLRPDMTVSVTIQAGERPAALVVPLECVHDGDSTQPWVLLRRDRKDQRANVRLGLRNDRVVEVVEGLADGDQVVPPAAPAAGGQKIHPWD